MEVPLTRKKAAVILLLVLLVAAFALPGSADMNKYSTVFMDTFDTVISLIGYAENQETFDARAAETHAMYLHLHKLFDTYNSYADEGITGTSLKKRTEFKKMITACKRGHIDLIITKSLSRFARNTVDLSLIHI